MYIFGPLTILAITVSFAASTPIASQRTGKRDVIDNGSSVDYDYIVVGSGAGGGPLAARLAVGGAKVLLMEAGDDQGASLQQSIPAFFPAASEYAPMSWDFFVRHYSDESREKLNSKATYETPAGETYVGTSPPEGSTFKGIWYPRAATLGGCAAHNAMVTVYPHEEDWTLIQSLTGDDSWAPQNMRKYWERIENNQYLGNSSDAARAGHGFDGWLGVSKMADELIVQDPQMAAMLSSASALITGSTPLSVTNVSDVEAIFPVEMNTETSGRDTSEGIYSIPLTVQNGVRTSPRDFLLAVANAVNDDGTKKYTLDIKLNAFVTKILFTNDSTPVAFGVEYLDGASQYSADPRASTATAGSTNFANATREVIISAGTFNTPQILKLSGIGPANELASFGIDVVSDLPGVGTNLQDHYEISTVIKYEEDFDFLDGCTFLSTADDACYARYATGSNEAGGKGAYATNLIPAAVIRKSSVTAGERDSFIFGGPVKFTGYFQGYTAAALADHKHWSWLALKAHELNHAGTVTLRSSNPLDTPQINFNYFDTGDTAGSADALDLQPQIESIAWTREVYKNIAAPYNNFTEIYPGPDVKTDAEVTEFIKNESWGHHATGTAKIGKASDPMAVVDGNFRVHGVSGLRVVDASVLPEVPGFFPVVSVYMIGEKAADIILADAI
ncbi:choline dehydrogenase [Cadophora sp. MPI-SDFR-AT-0126]|nr:choline dehydrogenase [Leotiomycetes sp. MPI-SDFR-AT-0126]